MMAESTSDTASFQLPRFVRNANALAERYGLTVTRVYVDHRDHDEEKKPVLFADWRGTAAQLLSLPLAPRHWNLPVKCRQLVFGGGQVWWHHPPLKGDATVHRDHMLYRVDFDEVPRAVTQQGAVERIEYSDETAYHGSADDLIAVGIDRKRIPMGKRISTRSKYSRHDPAFCTSRQLDGSYVHWLQTDAAFQRERQRYEECIARWTSPAAAPDTKLQKEQSWKGLSLADRITRFTDKADPHMALVVLRGYVEDAVEASGMKLRAEDHQRLQKLIAVFENDFCGLLHQSKLVPVERSLLSLVVDNTLGRRYAKNQ